MRAGLLGRRLGHSLSPQMHRFFGDYEYRLYEREPEAVESFVRSSGLDLLNVTIPYKKTVAAICDELTPLAERLGNVNLVTRLADGRLRGDNTDYFGFSRLLDSVCDSAGLPRVAAVLGAGGAATTAKTVLEDRGVEVVIVGRGETPPPDAGLIVNATPVGMYPDVDGRRIDITGFPSCGMVLDLVYNPSPTRLVREALESGRAAADGMVMLIAQAYRAYLIASGDRAPSGNLYLYGPPASGKTTWARRLASATGMPLVDVDAEIVKGEGRPIADIFAADGEAAFRRIERETLARVASAGGQVVALGGGALLDEESRRLAETTGRVVLLKCPEKELLRRAAASSERPLLAGDSAERLRALLAARRRHYESFAVTVDAGGGLPAESREGGA